MARSADEAILRSRSLRRRDEARRPRSRPNAGTGYWDRLSAEGEGPGVSIPFPGSRDGKALPGSQMHCRILFVHGGSMRHRYACLLLLSPLLGGCGAGVAAAVFGVLSLSDGDGDDVGEDVTVVLPPAV